MISNLVRRELTSYIKDVIKGDIDRVVNEIIDKVLESAEFNVKTYLEYAMEDMYEKMKVQVRVEDKRKG